MSQKTAISGSGLLFEIASVEPATEGVRNKRKNNQNWLPSIFNEFFDDNFGFTPVKQFASPAVNVVENEKDYQIELAAPGMTKGDFSIRLENDNELSIKLEKKVEDKKEKKNYLRRESSQSLFPRKRRQSRFLLQGRSRYNSGNN